MNIDPDTLAVLKKFRQAATFHQRVFKDYPEGGRQLTFLGISKTENVEIRWSDIDVLARLYDSARQDD